MSKTKRPDMDEATFRGLCEAWDRDAGPHSAEDALRFAYLLAMETKQRERDMGDIDALDADVGNMSGAVHLAHIVDYALRRIARGHSHQETLTEACHRIETLLPSEEL